MIPSDNGIRETERSAENANLIEAGISFGAYHHRTAEHTFVAIIDDYCVHIVVVNGAQLISLRLILLDKLRTSLDQHWTCPAEKRNRRDS